MSNDTEVNQENETLGQETSPDDKKEQADGSQPDTKAQLEALQNDIKALTKSSKHSAEVTENMQNALKVEREKRKALQDKLKGKTEESEFDPKEMENFKKALKTAGALTKEELEAIQAKKSQEETIQKNSATFQKFINSNQGIFGTDDDATPEQEKNLKVFSQYLNEYFDINKTTLANTKNLDKKLKKALNDLKGGVSTKQAESKGIDKALAQQKNNVLLSIGAEGGSGTETKDDNWKYGTPKAEAAQHLKAIGYSDKEIKEMLNRPKK